MRKQSRPTGYTLYDEIITAKVIFTRTSSVWPFARPTLFSPRFEVHSRKTSSKIEPVLPAGREFSSRDVISEMHEFVCKAVKVEREADERRNERKGKNTHDDLIKARTERVTLSGRDQMMANRSDETQADFASRATLHTTSFPELDVGRSNAKYLSLELPPIARASSPRSRKEGRVK